MAEIRCPMCGKPNPDDLDVCQFCQARLKPLIASSPSDDTPLNDDASFPEKPESQEDLPDWLDFDADADFEEADDAPFSNETPFDGGDDLLSRLEGVHEPEDPSPPLPEAEIDLPDWLSAASDQPTVPLEEGNEEITRPDRSSGHDSPDAQIELPASDDDETASTSGYVGQETIPVEDMQGDTDLPDWLTDLGIEATVSGKETTGGEDISDPNDTFSLEAPITSDDADELPDWLTGEDDEVAESVLPAAENELHDWLPDLGSDESAEPDEAAPSQASTPIFTPDDQALGVTAWLTEGGPEEVETVLSSAVVDLPDNLSGDDAEDVESELPDWLSDLGGIETTEPTDTTPEQESAPAFTTDESAELPDWLSDLNQAEDDVIESPLPDAEDELPSWLSDPGDEEIGDDDEVVEPKVTDPAQPPIQDATGDHVDELPDWLPDLGSDATSEPEEIIPEQESAPVFTTDESDELPDWLSELSSEEDGETESPLPDAKDELPSWLSAPGDEVVEQKEADHAQIPIQDFISDEEDELPDWLSDEGEADTADALQVAESELPDWLSDVGGEEDEEVDSAIPAAEGEMPDWLSDLGGDDTTETEEITPVEASVPAFTADDAQELSDWLSDQDGEDAEESIETISAQPHLPTITSDDVEELPDWLDGEGDEDSDSILPLVESETIDSLSDLGDGEAALSEEIEEPEEPTPAQTSVPAISTADVEDLPDWLSDLGGEEVGSEMGIPTFAVTEELPDWLSEVDGIEEEPTEELSPEIELDIPPASVDESRAVPSWLHEMEETPEVEALDDTSLYEDEDEPAEAISLELEDGFEDDLGGFDQLPEWLGDSPQPEVDQVQEITGPVDDEIAPAELPGWLAAMRPVEPAASDSVDPKQRGTVESIGPLAGLYSVLAAEPEIAQMKKPPVYSNKLQITEAQQTHATILQDMLQAEGKTQPLPSEPLISSHRVFRLILGIILIVIALFAVFVSGDMVAMPTPEVIPSGVDQTYQIVSALSPENTALVAFEYEPGLVGEMDATAAAVVDNMMAKGVKLVFISTSPTGPALAQRFINDVQGEHNYISGTQYVNLGYIPGGISGLAAFAQNPSWVSPTTLDGTQAWETEPLRNIQNVSDFALVLLITDNPNTTRAWVEQVNPQLEPVPLVAVVSAQVEPIARTYQGQIDGLVSGLTGGAAYEVISNSSNLAREQWDAFNIILIVGVSAILIGAVISISSIMITRQKKHGGESP